MLKVSLLFFVYLLALVSYGVPAYSETKNKKDSITKGQVDFKFRNDLKIIR